MLQTVVAKPENLNELAPNHDLTLKTRAWKRPLGKYFGTVVSVPSIHSNIYPSATEETFCGSLVLRLEAFAKVMLIDNKMS